MRIDQLPVFGAVGAHAFAGGAKNVGKVAANLALVSDTGQSTGAGQHAEQWHFGQAHGGAAVIDHDDAVAGQRQLVATTGASARHRGNRFEAVVP